MSNTEPAAPAFSSQAPNTTRGILASTTAPAHMAHGSSVTTRVQSSSRQPSPRRRPAPHSSRSRAAASRMATISAWAVGSPAPPVRSVRSPARRRRVRSRRRRSARPPWPAPAGLRRGQGPSIRHVAVLPGSHGSMIVSKDNPALHTHVTPGDSRETPELASACGKWVGPYAALWITMLVGGVLVVILALLGAEVYDNVVDDDGLAILDKPALEVSMEHSQPGLDAVVTAFTNIGGGIGMPILASILDGLADLPQPDLAAAHPGGRRGGGVHHGHHAGQDTDRPDPPGPRRRRPAVRDLAVVSQRPHAQHHGGDRRRGVPRCACRSRRTWARVAAHRRRVWSSSSRWA